MGKKFKWCGIKGIIAIIISILLLSFGVFAWKVISIAAESFTNWVMVTLGLTSLLLTYTIILILIIVILAILGISTAAVLKKIFK